jgi:CBS domain-containing protein
LGTEGRKPHLRIENRYIPAGPTLVDEIANAAFWIGLMEGRPKDVKNFSKLLDFDDVHANFSKAAQWGLEAQFRWFEGKLISAQDLILDHLLPMAKEGLQQKGVSKDAIDKYLNIIELRVSKVQTGSIWMLNSFRNLRKNASVSDASLTITSFCKENCLLESPVHEWPILTKKYAYFSPIKSKTAEDIMDSDIVTIRKHDLLDFGLQVMEWKNLTHVPVEDEKGKLCGILAKPSISEKLDKECSVEEAMLKDFISVCPETSFHEVKKLMKKNAIHCLPVMVKGVLAGIILEEDIKKISEFESS